ncbi:ead/Ea22-like family protein [Atlantibacter sp. RC6]|uniref:ead/Ea22-like family protein n=1 Tax=Atlantibacter sp. RC6 TaxID=2587036 RepID=UPI00178EE012|nr:hypothetical protein [Atlantibacter sp. RC6]
MTMTAEQRAQLREVAERATCGRWELSFPCDSDSATIDREVEGFIPICVIEGAHPDGGYDEDFQSEQQANAEFIAAFHHAVALALLDELERKDKRIAELNFVCKSADQVQREYAEALGCAGDNESILVAIDEIKSRITELEARTVTVKLPEYKCSPDMHTKQFYETVGFNAAIDEFKRLNGEE